MDIKFKHRVIFSVVIIAIIVVFVPMLFHKHQKIVEINAIPEAPKTLQFQQNSLKIIGSNVEKNNMLQKTVVKNVPLKTDQSNFTENGSSIVINHGAINHKTVSIPSNVKSSKSFQIHVDRVQSRNQGKVQVVKAAPIKEFSEKDSAKLLAKNTLTPKTKEIDIRQVPIRHNHLVSKNISKSTNLLHETKKWVVQIGSFADSHNAMHMIRKLRAKKFSAFSYKLHKGNDIITKVYVGPAMTRKSADVLLNRLKSNGFKGFINSKLK